MNTFINYIFYGFYQIDYIFGVRPYPKYHISTGTVLFAMSVSLYIYSATLLLAGYGVLYNIIDYLPSDFLEILFMLTGFVVVIWLYYWLRKKKYISTFEKLDREPSSMRLVCFVLALLWGGGGIASLCGCSNFLRKIMAIG
jgi:uncharacterized membrane protein YfcA